ncbi:Uncharacterized protein ESCO_005643 [Escovopsis weberi]|uniref:Cyclin-D1-binding protein 1-like N-terminal domain-containing protein n=1 Tax=Escovopsis weberi TaxID=150374 RepID=A0A0M8N4T3_ESCWE|nr:Uncharacterized protein ESCO_005643 [Escovopsis weberi]
MGSSSDTVSLEQLDALVQPLASHTTTIILFDLTSATANIPEPATPATPTTPAVTDPVALARDAAALIRANVTKLSLLIINEPFSPSAIAPLLGSSALLRPLLALLAAVQSCDPEAYTLPFRQDLAHRAHRLLSELAGFLAKIPADGKALTGAQRDGGFSSGSGSGSGSGSAADRGSIPATALVWSACDAVAAVADLGVAGFLAHRLSDSKDTLDDIMQELKEWSEQDPDDDNDDDDDDFDDDADSSDELDQGDAMQRMLDDLMAQKAIPADDPDGIRPRLAATLRKLRMVVLLYQAVIKRRIKKLPPLPWPRGDTHPDIAQQLDRAVTVLGRLPDAFGDLAAAFYEMRAPAIDEAMAQCFEDAASASELLAKNWTGVADEFTQWTEKFQSELRKT